MKNLLLKIQPTLKKYWLVLAGLIVVIAGVVGYNVYVSADSSFNFSVEYPVTFIMQGANGTAVAQFEADTGYNTAKYGVKVMENNVTKPDLLGNQVDIGFIWKATDPNNQPVFDFQAGINKGRYVNLVSKGAGVSQLYADYVDFIYLDAQGNKTEYNAVDDLAPVSLDYVRATSSDTIDVKVPLEIIAKFNGGQTFQSSNVMNVESGDFIRADYNGYVRVLSIGGDQEYLNDIHEVNFKFNTFVLSHQKTVNSTNTWSKFTALGGGRTKIKATVGPIENPEVTAEIPSVVYVKPKFKIASLQINKNEVHALSSVDTNVIDNNFGYVDDEGQHSVFFWTTEDYEKSVNPDAAVVQVLRASESGVLTGENAGKTTLYMSCKPMAESYVNGSIDPNVVSSIPVEVPFITYFENTVIVSVGDNIPVLTSAYTDNVTYTPYNNTGAIGQTETPGIFKALQAGTAQVKIAAGIYDNGAIIPQDEILVTIIVIDKLMVSHESISVNVDQSADVFAIPTCTDTSICSKVSWTSADPSIATVTFDNTDFDSCLNAKITGIKKGKTVVTCMQTVDGVVKIATINVNVTVPVDGISLSEPSNGADHLTMYLGQTTTIYAYLQYSNNEVPDNTSLIWTVSGNQLLSLQPTDTEGVTQACQVTATGIGQTTITVYSTDSNQIITCDVVISEHPTSITLSDDNVVAYMSLQKYQLEATVNSANGGADQTVIWSSLDEKVVKVDPSTGLVTFVAPGSTYILCTSVVDPTVYAYCRFTVAQDVYGIILDKTELTLKVGDTYRITASINPDDAFDKTMIWTSSNPDIIAVENTDKYENLLTATGSGSATIFAETNDGGYIAYCNVKVLQPVTSMTISSSEMTVRKGTVFYLNAICLPDSADDKTIVWSSNDESIATVSNDGRVTTLSVGQCVITATNPDSEVTVSCTVNVLEPVTGLTLNTYFQNMVKDTRFVLIPTVEPITASDKTVSYWSSDEDVATVDDKGVITAKNGGTCEIVVTTKESSISAKCTIVVKEYVSSIELSDSFRYLNRGDTYQITATVGTPTASDKTLIWTSSNPNIATVNEKGEVTGVAYGNVVITATAADGSGISASCIMRVIKPVTEIILDHTKTTMYVGDLLHIIATVKPDDASVKTIEWSSSDPTVARVYDDGDVEAMGVGRCKIFAKSTDGNDIVAECTIIVKQIVQATSLSINSHEIVMLKGKTRTLTTRLYPNNATESVKWLSTDTSIVTVDNNGQITTVGAGVCDVIAYTTYGTVQDVCKVYSMAISRTDVVLEQYDSFNLYVDGAPSTISWRSNQPRVATITSGGVVTARMPGETTVTATVDGKTMVCNIKVIPVDPGRFINPTEDTLLNGFNKDLSYTQEKNPYNNMMVPYINVNLDPYGKPVNQ